MTSLIYSALYFGSTQNLVVQPFNDFTDHIIR
jgi:hypothetical protein